MVPHAARGLRGNFFRGSPNKESAVDLTNLAPIALALLVIIWGKRW